MPFRGRDGSSARDSGEFKRLAGKQDGGVEMYPPEFWRRYRDIMSLVWESPRNDQRPAVRRFLATLSFERRRVIDIGPGDAYYLEDVNPSEYVAVEPNPEFLRSLASRAAKVGATCVLLERLSDLIRAEPVLDASVVLLLHVLLYLEEGELRDLLPRVRSLPLVVVHPCPSLATTSRLARRLGVFTDELFIGVKETILGTPSVLCKVNTHLHVPADTSIDDIAFLISHRMLLGSEKGEEVLSEARAFTRENVASWRNGDHISIPQPQTMEAYNIQQLNVN